jgi:hypothetical protein
LGFGVATPDLRYCQNGQTTGRRARGIVSLDFIGVVTSRWAALDAAQAPSKSMIISALPATSDVRFTVAGLYLPDDDDAPGI